MFYLINLSNGYFYIQITKPLQRLRINRTKNFCQFLSDISTDIRKKFKSCKSGSWHWPQMNWKVQSPIWYEPFHKKDYVKVGVKANEMIFTKTQVMTWRCYHYKFKRWRWIKFFHALTFTHLSVIRNHFNSICRQFSWAPPVSYSLNAP